LNTTTTAQFSAYLKTIPVNPGIATKVLQMVQRQEYSFKQLESIISADPGLTAKILKIANSAMYARQNRVTKLQSAMTLLGINTIKNVVILVSGTSIFKSHAGSKFYKLFWKHSLATAFVSRELALRVGLQEFAEEAFIAGLLHNVGQVAFYLHDPVAYEALVAEVVRNGGRFSELENAAFGTTHKDVGGEVLRLWSFPDMYSDCAREHGDVNVMSSWKKLILTVSVSAFVASNWFYFSEEPKPFPLLGPLLVNLGLDAPGIETYQAEYRERLEQDSFYKECQNLIMV